MPRSAPGPGAGRPKRRTSRRQPRKASWPVTFCSMQAATSASSTRPVRGTRQCGLRVQASRTSGSAGSKSLGSSSAPSMAGAWSSAHAAPGPQASSSIVASARRRTIRSVTCPAGVMEPRQIVPSGSSWNVGSPGPRRSPRRMSKGSHGHAGRHVRCRDAGARRRSATHEVSLGDHTDRSGIPATSCTRAVIALPVQDVACRCGRADWAAWDRCC